MAANIFEKVIIRIFENWLPLKRDENLSFTYVFSLTGASKIRFLVSDAVCENKIKLQKRTIFKILH